MRRIWALTALALLVAACGNGASDDTTPPTTATTATTTTSTTLPTTTTTIPPDTTTTTTTTSTTTAPGDTTAPTITVWGSLQVYSADGVITLSGALDEAGTVSIPGAAISVGPDLEWIADFEREPGTHAVTITAEDVSGNRSELVLELTVDPELEVVFAYVTAFDGSTITADYATFLTGEEATAAAREDGVIGADETVPNDFYIRNENPMLRDLPLAGTTASVVLQACFLEGPCVRPTAVTLGQWANLLIEQPADGLPEGWQWYGGGGLPYWLTLQDGVVVHISEQYLP